jgi:predicted RNA-binding Zn-ribbon protein involved in translation (DUF1610 family)
MVMMVDHARCWTCGYQLRGLEGSQCPECGRAFDAADVSTFDHRSPIELKRRRIRIGILILIAILLAVAVFPREMIRGKLTFACRKCGVEQITQRWEPKFPEWIGLRLPGVHWRSGLVRKANEKRPECATHSFDHLTAELWMPGSPMRVTGWWDPGEHPLINDQIATPETTVDVLKFVMDPKNTWIGISFAPDESTQTAP